MLPEFFVQSPFSVIIDTREQRKYKFQNLKSDKYYGEIPISVKCVSGALKTGDYSIKGYENEITIERKSKSDLFGSIGRRENFEARLNRMSAMRHAHVVVEAELGEIFEEPPHFTEMQPKTIARTVISWTLKHPNVHWWFLPGRAAAEAITYRIFEMFWSHLTQQANTNGSTIR